MVWWLITLWFLPALLVLGLFLVDRLTGMGRRRTLAQNDPNADSDRDLNVTDTSAATHDCASGQTQSGPHQLRRSSQTDQSCSICRSRSAGIDQCQRF